MESVLLKQLLGFLTMVVLLATAPWARSSTPPEEATSNDDAPAQSNLPNRGISLAQFWMVLDIAAADDATEMGVDFGDINARLMHPTGVAVAGWEQQGVDIAAYLSALPGGIDKNGLLTPTELPSLRFLGKIPADILDDWEIVRTGPKAILPSAATGGVFVAIGPSHIMFAAQDSLPIEKIGHANCISEEVRSHGEFITVFRHKSKAFDLNDPSPENEEYNAAVLFQLFKKIKLLPLCSLHKVLADGRLSESLYTPKGEPFAFTWFGEPSVAEATPTEIISDFDLLVQLGAKFRSTWFDSLR